MAHGGKHCESHGMRPLGASTAEPPGATRLRRLTLPTSNLANQPQQQ